MSKRNRIQAEKVSNETQAFDLIVQGLSFREVADRLNTSRSTAHRWFRDAMNGLKVPDEKIKEWRILISARLDFTIAPMLNALHEHNLHLSTAGDQGTRLSVRDMGDIARAVARVEDRRAKMLGLDKPTKIDITHNVPAPDPENAAQRITQLLRDAQFPPLRTAIPIAMIPAPKEANGNSDQAT